MVIPDNTVKLTKLFQQLGASEPAGWAESQVNEGINQLHRFLFLRQAWSRIIADGDKKWIQTEIEAAQENPNAPFAGTGLALKRLLACGGAESDISDVVRGMQAKLLFDLCYLLEDPCLEAPEVSNIGWRLVETDSEFEPTSNPIACLHESVLETDPSGREMRPKCAT